MISILTLYHQKGPEVFVTKKIISIFLSLVLVLGLAACGSTETPSNTTKPASTGLQVGFGRESIMPEDYTKAHLAGGGWGYMPDPLGIQIGCYESCVTNFAPGTGEELAQAFVDMLAELRK